MNRPGAILIPMLGGFLLTVAVVSWRSGWWQRHEALGSHAAAPLSVELRHPNLRVVPVHLTAAPPASVAAAAAASHQPAPAAGGPEAVAEPLEPPPVPRANAGNSPDLEVPVRKFARGSRADAE